MGQFSNLSKTPELKGTTPFWMQDLQLILFFGFWGYTLNQREEEANTRLLKIFKNLGKWKHELNHKMQSILT